MGGALSLHKFVQEEQQEGGVFGPDEIAVMTTAFDQLLRDFKLSDRDDPLVEMLAKLVIELVRNGERDPNKLREQVLGRHSPLRRANSCSRLFIFNGNAASAPCSRCGRDVDLVTVVDRFGDRPPVYIFRCPQCERIAPYYRDDGELRSW
jgi:hypothetical protein